MKSCAWVDNMLSVEPDGWTRPCCGETAEKARIANINDGILNAFNATALLELKQELDGRGFSERTAAFCNRCDKVEAKGLNSLRTGTRRLSDTRELKMIQFKLSNRCQLTCLHCGPELSSGWTKLKGIIPLVQETRISDAVLAELVTLLPQLEVIKFTGGEPFLDPMHWKILQALSKYSRSHCTIQYITNGLRLPTPAQLKLWEGWKNVECSVSADGFEATYEWFRRGAKWSDLVASVTELRQHSTVSINYSVTPWTAMSFGKAQAFWGELHPFPIVHPMHASLAAFPMVVAKKHFSDAPFVDLCIEDTSLIKFRIWAIGWDAMWDTPGLAAKLHPWLMEPL